MTTRTPAVVSRPDQAVSALRRAATAIIVLTMAAAVLSVIGVVSAAAASAPTVTAVIASSGPIAGGQRVIVTGTGLASPTVVDFGAAAAAIVSSTATTVTVTEPAGTVGTVTVTVAMLSSAGYQVDTVADGAAAVSASTTRGYDAILMDCQMPKLDGYEATAAIRTNEGSFRHTPIVAMTAAARQEDQDRCAAAGMDTYVSKPVDKVTLLAKVADLLRGGPDETVPLPV